MAIDCNWSKVEWRIKSCQWVQENYQWEKYPVDEIGIEELKKVLLLLRIKPENITGQLDFDRIAKRAMRFWHPDNALRKHLNQQTIEVYTSNFQKIPDAIKILRQYSEARIDRVRHHDSSTPRHYFAAGNDPAFLLFRSIKFNRIDLAEKLIKAGANSNSVFKKRTLLMFSALWGRKRIAELLINAGAFIDMQVNHQTALMIAIDANQPKMVRLFLQSGANPGLKTQTGWTILMRSINTKNPEIVSDLLSTGVDVNARTTGGWTALMQAVEKENLEVIELLVQAGANKYAENRSGSSAVKMAVQKKNKGIMGVLRC